MDTLRKMRLGSIATALAILAFSSSARAAYWLEDIQHNGVAINHLDSANYSVFRNVRNYGAVGDGVTDDTIAINNAISSGGRCGLGCNSSTASPAMIYFPSGTYLVSSPIIALFYSQLIGDYNQRPTLLASANFTGIAVVDADPYGPGGVNYYINQNNWWRDVRNFVIDLRRSSTAVGVCLASGGRLCGEGLLSDYLVPESTQLTNIHFEMTVGSNTTQKGVIIENGSGGEMSDLSFHGGLNGLSIGNQQFTQRNLRFSQVQTAIDVVWNWATVYINVTIDDCQVGVSASAIAGSVNALDFSIVNTPIGFNVTNPRSVIYLENLRATNVSTLVQSSNSSVYLAGSSGVTNVQAWSLATVYSDSGTLLINGTANLPSPNRPDNLVLGPSRIYYGRNIPQYGSATAESIVNIKSFGVRGDGVTDDTTALQAILNNSTSSIVWIPHGQYMVSRTLTIPAGSRLVGECWPKLIGTGPAFSDAANPMPVFKVGSMSGEEGTMEITSILFMTKAPTPGAIVVEWNIAQAAQGAAGIWNSHIMLGGIFGTNASYAQCNPNATGANPSLPDCHTAFMGLHISKEASGYFEGTWVWNADHDVDTDPTLRQINVYGGRGTYVESQGPVWWYGLASEHFVLYQYHFNGASNIMATMLQAETAYFQGGNNSVASDVAPPNSTWSDPTFSKCAAGDRACNKGIGLLAQNSTNVMLYGVGLYSFFDNYRQECIALRNCQTSITQILDGNTNFFLQNLATIGATDMAIFESNSSMPIPSAPSNITGSIFSGIGRVGTAGLNSSRVRTDAKVKIGSSI